MLRILRNICNIRNGKDAVDWLAKSLAVMRCIQEAGNGVGSQDKAEALDLAISEFAKNLEIIQGYIAQRGKVK
jgi:hypothetical protein